MVARLVSFAGAILGVVRGDVGGSVLMWDAGAGMVAGTCAGTACDMVSATEDSTMRAA